MSSNSSIPYNFRTEFTTSDHCDYERHFRCEVTRNKSSNYWKMLSVSSPYLLCFCHKTDEPRLYKHFGIVHSYIVNAKSFSCCKYCRSSLASFSWRNFHQKFANRYPLKYEFDNFWFWNFPTFVLILITADQWRTCYAGPDSWFAVWFCVSSVRQWKKIKTVVIVINVICETRNFRKTFKIRKIGQNQKMKECQN